ncbi:MAG: erythromycin esterase family protein [Myxococcales bacterium]|nr:erythromycin esterase family protein [Myxococcales bacterium]
MSPAIVSKVEVPLAPPSDPLWAGLNLNFEAVVDGQPEAWKLGAGGGLPQGEGGSDRDAHGGVASFRLTAGPDGFGTASVSVDATTLRGKRVSLHGWVKTEVVGGDNAQVWLRVDRRPPAYGTPPVGDPSRAGGWREAVAVVDVPDDAERLTLGPGVVGAGAAWFDDFSIAVEDIPAPHPVVVMGRVIDDAGAPVAGAEVRLVDPQSSSTPAATSGPDGGFRVVTTSGRFGLTAYKAGSVGGFVDTMLVEADIADVRITLPRAGGVLVVGRAVMTDPVPAGTRVNVWPVSANSADLFSFPVAADGTFGGQLPLANEYGARVDAARLTGLASVARAGDRVVIDLEVSVLAPPPPAVADWLTASAIRIATADPDHDLDDLEPLKKIVGKARIVALGEATHGTREFFQLKHRVVRYLVERLGFTVFAIEANQPECRAIHDYVLTGAVDPRHGLDGIHFWTWNTEEVLAMIEWMRAWNADPRHVKKVQFTGFDMQYTDVAAASVAAFVQQVAPGEVALVAPLSDAKAEVRRAAVPAVVARFEQLAKSWRAAAGTAAYELARQDLRVLEQEAAMAAAGAGGYRTRDMAMADNAEWILAHQPKGTGMVVWAHNGHVGVDATSYAAMGSDLRRRFGTGYVVFGFVFGQGSFQAIDGTKGRGDTLREHTLGPAPESDASTPFARVGQPTLVADLRTAPHGVVATWFAAPHPMRDVGAVFSNEANMTSPVALSRAFDAVIYVDKTTRARPLPGGIRPKPAPAPEPPAP